MSVIHPPEIVAREPVRGGYTPAERWRLRLAGGGTAFMKRAVNEQTAEALRLEIEAYHALAGAPFLAEMLFSNDGAVPELWLEDLSHAYWPGPWRPGDVSRVVATLDAVHDTPLLAALPTVELGSGWASIAKSPAAFLALGWVTEAWLCTALPVLVASESARPSGPDGLLHQDVRSDNICILPDRVVLIDWNGLSRGPREVDRAFWAASLEAEGGARCEELVAESEPWAATVSGFFAWRAGQPPLAGAPRVRWIQRVQLATSLAWAVRTYGISEPDGQGWSARDHL